MFTIIWRFTVDPDKAAAFETHYRAGGTWAQLFRKSSAYRGTELFRDTANNVSWITIDSWDTRESYEAFKRDYRAEYEALDQKCEQLTQSEEKVGEFGL